MNYKPEACKCCGRKTTYLLALDRGVADIVLAISYAVKLKGKNSVHIHDEMKVMAKDYQDYEKMILNGKMTPEMAGNIKHASAHGLVAKVTSEKKGTYCLTKKGADFLRGKEVEKYAILDQVLKHQVGYWLGEDVKYTSVKELYKNDQYWEIPDFTIEDGRIVKDLPVARVPMRQDSLFKLSAILN